MYRDTYIYKHFFAKDKPFRHIWQHFLVASAAYAAVINMFPLQVTSSTILLFLACTYLPDLDGLTYVLRNRKDKEISKIINYLKKFQPLKAMHQASVIHKKFNGLVIHNIYGLWGLVIILGCGFYLKNYLLIMCGCAVLAHFLFDILDDIYQVGHIKNWLR